jgi:hypothetical protein
MRPPTPLGSGKDTVLPLIVGCVHDADHSLATRIKVNVVYLDGLAVAPPMPIESLEQFSLQFEQLNSVAAIDVDEVLSHVDMALAP